MPRPKTSGPPTADPIRDGDPTAVPTAYYCPEHKCSGHLNAAGEFVPHEAPAGWKHTPHGLVPTAVKESSDNG